MNERTICAISKIIEGFDPFPFLDNHIHCSLSLWFYFFSMHVVLKIRAFQFPNSSHLKIICKKVNVSWETNIFVVNLGGLIPKNKTNFPFFKTSKQFLIFIHFVQKVSRIAQIILNIYIRPCKFL